MKKWILAGLLIIALAAACAPQPGTQPVPQTSPQPQVEKLPTAAFQAHCRYGACVRDTIMARSESNLLVFFDLTDQNGIVILGDEKYITGNLLVAGYLLSGDGSEQTVFQAELTNQDYNCYSGKDLPWNPGIPTATCGFSVPVSDLKVVPEVGDRVRVELPVFNSFAQEVVVQERAALE